MSQVMIELSDYYDYSIHPIKQYDYESHFNISSLRYRLVDNLEKKFDIAQNEANDINSFLCSNVNSDNMLMNILLNIAEEINKINPSIKTSLKLINDDEEFLEVSPKVNNFDDSCKIDNLNDDLIDKYPLEYMDKIVISMEFP